MGLLEIHLRDADEIEAFYLETTGMRPGFLQLSSGVSGMSMQVIDLDGVTLVWATVNGRSRWCDEVAGDGLHLGLALESAGPVKVRGHEISGDELQVWLPGEQTEYLMEGPVRTLEISVAGSLLETLGWVVRGDSLRSVGQARLNRLADVCRLVSLASTAPSQLGRDRILDELEPILQPWIGPEFPGLCAARESRHHRLFKATERYFRTLASDEKLDVGRMAGQIGVPRRTVFHAYRQLMGIGPRRYLELVRLQELRRRLKSAAPGETSVTKEASRLGFFHPGRLPLAYRRQYGENPVQTLNRV